LCEINDELVNQPLVQLPSPATVQYIKDMGRAQTLI
jgi:hypothetical protein